MFTQSFTELYLTPKEHIPGLKVGVQQQKTSVCFWQLLQTVNYSEFGGTDGRFIIGRGRKNWWHSIETSRAACSTEQVLTLTARIWICLKIRALTPQWVNWQPNNREILNHCGTMNNHKKYQSPLINMEIIGMEWWYLVFRPDHFATNCAGGLLGNFTAGNPALVDLDQQM